ncbi:cytochrome b/b6 domain-containing protein [Halobaculum sp. CBA1158]|uniref:cytochrome b/b6 domain-containing protein n=1 Tax=Halobaculum sp. CBA1158 TaxID=2904243 RepID=UPI001F3C880E|nr:cytochrome b/b6 domain-containing protein [Halobaculum sp. CBA1158]UIO99540.1 cytochrome b/b6 domain-containing protein [Halobaculum sp. CBA1158]
MTQLDHGKFSKMTTTFHTLLALDVFVLFFSGYSLMFNDELWWMVGLMGGATGVSAVHRVAGAGLLALIVFWMLMMITTDTGRGNFREILPSKSDFDAFIQDVQFLLGNSDERHPNARQFAGGTADEIPLLTYIGKGVVFIFAIELTLLSISGILIWSKTGVMGLLATKTAAAAFVTFHGLLGVIMLMGVMFHIFEHGFHPALYPVEVKAFIPKSMIPEQHDDDAEGTGIERLELAPSWNMASTVIGALTVIGIVSVLLGSLFDEGYPVPRDIAIGGGPTDILLTVGINAGMFVLLLGMVLQMYGNLLRVRWQKQLEQEASEPTTAADGGHVESDD